MRGRGRVQSATIATTSEGSSIDSNPGRPHGNNVKHLFLLLLLLGVVAGLTLHPTQALAGPMGVMPMATAHGSTAVVHDCMAAKSKDATPASCKCGIAACLAMMASDAPIMRVDGVVPIGAWPSTGAVEHHFVSTVLSGRTTAPEPEPPSA